MLKLIKHHQSNITSKSILLCTSYNNQVRGIPQGKGLSHVINTH